jgi:hypothetical protein
VAQALNAAVEEDCCLCLDQLSPGPGPHVVAKVIVQQLQSGSITRGQVSDTPCSLCCSSVHGHEGGVEILNYHVRHMVAYACGISTNVMLFLGGAKHSWP